MNIKEAKEQIKNAMIAYFSKDDTGEYAMPPERQRPVFLIGAPGIGKTAIMEQIAAEMGVGLLSYSMTHHTRQSALGLPYIVKRNYGGTEFEVSEYTMSEIIASVYELMESTGVREGILFLDEINCVSETLSPIMLQFLQYKVFGRHKVPAGWIVVTAGNPPEYNNSVHDFDIVTWDRLKRVDVEPDFNVWKEYAYHVNIHPAVITYLEIKTGDFYKIETTVDGKHFVTARGWEDLSRMIRLYEQNDLNVDINLIGQYLQNSKIARSFAQYYDLFKKYRSDYQIATILEGKAPDEILKRAQGAKFDERLSLIGLMLEAVTKETTSVMEHNRLLTDLMTMIKDIFVKTARGGSCAKKIIETIIKAEQERLEAGRRSASMSGREQRQVKLLINALCEMSGLLNDMPGSEDKAILKKYFDERVARLKAMTENTKAHMTNMILFGEKAFEDGQEMIIIVTELTANADNASFIAKFGCDAYFKHNRDLLLYERGLEIKNALDSLDPSLLTM